MTTTRAPGTVIAGRYRLLQRVGEGGMGEVWEVHDAALDERVALKLITTPSPHAAERFRREVKLARRVVHPRCARVFDLGEDGDEMFLTMELVDGTSLAKLLHARKLSLGAAWSVLADVCGALAAVHAIGVVHRDLKPGNILVDHKGRGVVIDFGVARDLGDASPALTQGAIGTFDFMAPEQVEGRHDVTPAADIYSLGTVLFACVTRRLPFVEGNEAARALARTLRPAPALASVQPNVTHALADIVDRSLARAADGRPALDEIHRVLEDEERRERTREAAATAAREAVPLATHGDETVLDVAPVGETSDAPHGDGGLVTRRVVVLPFEGAELGPLVAEELADALGRIRGLEVVAPHTVGADATEVDAARAFGGDGATLHVVTGVVAVGPERTLDVAARLVDAAGAQVWRASFRAGAAELFASDGALARRIAEALRLELDGRVGVEVPHEAGILYMRARHVLRGVAASAMEETLALLDECLELAPAWPPAIAARAIACARARFVTTAEGAAVTAEEAAAAVQRALLLAPDLVDTHYAAAMLAVEEARIGEAVDRLRAALELAPMHALSLAMLGRLACELGRVQEGVAHIRQAARIDPSSGGALASIAQAYALRGRLDDADRLLARARAQRDGIDVWGTTTRVRSWRGGPTDDVVDVLRRMGQPQDPMQRFVHASARLVVTGASEASDELRHWLRTAETVPLAPRAKALIFQLGAEIFARTAPEDALAWLEQSAEAGLIDVEWLAHCPVLAGLRHTPRFRAVDIVVRARAAAAWPAPRARPDVDARAADAHAVSTP